MKALAIRPPQFLSLEPVPRCPNRRCARYPTHDVNSDLLVFACQRCSARWWATRFAPGDIRPQLLEDYGGDESFVDYLMGMFELPLSIGRPMYWQVWISIDDHAALAKAMPSARVRDHARAFFLRLVTWHRSL